MIKSSRTNVTSPSHEGEPLVGALKRFLGALGAGTMAVSLRTNLTMPQFRTLHTIGHLGRVSGRQLARELGVSPAAVVPVCDRLEKEGYIQRIADTADRRITWVQLTAAGSSFFDEMAFVHRSRLVPALAALSIADRKTLSRLLDRLAAGLETSNPKATHTHRRPTPAYRAHPPRG